MKIGMVLPELPLPIAGYSGIEKAGLWMAEALVKRGHDVTVYGNVVDENWAPPFKWHRLANERLSFDPLPELAQSDVVVDWTHLKTLRLARLKKYVAVSMWTDKNAAQGRDIYPSNAVRDAFNDPTGTVIPLGLPCRDWPVPPTPDAEKPVYLAPGKLQDIKGQDLAVAIARAHVKPPARFVVAGHTAAPMADPVYASRVHVACREAGFEFIGMPSHSELEALFAGATGVLHTHRWIESFSLAAAEALCRGVPVLTTDIGGTQEIVRATGGGMVTSLKMLEKGTPEATVAGFFDTNWRGRRAGIIKSARNLLDVDKIAERYEKVFA